MSSMRFSYIGKWKFYSIAFLIAFSMVFGIIPGGVDSRAAGADEASWENLEGPQANAITALVTDNDRNTYAGTVDGVYRLADGSSEWTKLAEGKSYLNGEGGLPEGTNIIAMDYFTPEASITADGSYGLVCVTGPFSQKEWDFGDPAAWMNGIWRYNSADDSWEIIKHMMPDPGIPNSVSCIVFDDNGNLYAGSGDGYGVWKCEDWADSENPNWERWDVGLPDDFYYITAIAFDGNLIYTAIWSWHESVPNGVWSRPPDESDTWQNFTGEGEGALPSGGEITDIAFDTVNGVYVASACYEMSDESGVYMSPIAGAGGPNWAIMDNNYPQEPHKPLPLSMICTAGSIYAGLEGKGVYRLDLLSEEWSYYWLDDSPEMPWKSHVMCLAHLPQILPPAGNDSEAALSPGTGKLIAGLVLDGVYIKEITEGTSFDQVNEGLPGHVNVFSVAFDAENEKLYAGTHAAAFAYENHEWKRMDRWMGSQNYLYEMVHHPDLGLISLPTFSGIKHYLQAEEEPGGRPSGWGDFNMDGIDRYVNNLHVDADGYLYAASDSFFRYNAEEEKWEDKLQGKHPFGGKQFRINRITSDCEGNIYILSDSRNADGVKAVLRSGNNGEGEWEEIGSDWPEHAAQPFNAREVAVDNEGNVFVGGSVGFRPDHSAVYRSKNGTGKWEAWKEGAPEGQGVQSMAIGQGGRVIASFGNDLCTLPKDGEEWEAFSSGLPDNSIVYDVITGSYYAGTSNGAYVREFELEGKIWYLAEGSTDGGMETWVLVQNPNDNDISVDLTLMTDQGKREPEGLQNQQIGANSRRTFAIHNYVTTFDVSTMVTSADGNIICERAMYGPGRIWAHDSIGTTTPFNTWFLAEGSTDGGMETWVLVQNPNDNEVTVDLTLMTSEGELKPEGLQGQNVGANSRRTFPIHEFVETFHVSTMVTSEGGDIICERAMYGPGRIWAHDSIGVNQSALNWYLAEGSTDGGMETWVLVQNPNDNEVTVDLTLMTSEGELKPEGLQGQNVGANSRRTFPIHEFVETFHVSTMVTSEGGDIICERAMYGPDRIWAHDSIGTTAPATTWYLAEGSTDGDMETWVLIQNPNDHDITVDLTLMTGDGEVKPDELQGVAMAPNSRMTFKINYYVTTYDVSTMVASEGGDIICERAMYGPDRIWAHNSIGYTYR